MQNRSWGAASVALRKQSATRAVGDYYSVEVGLEDPEAGPVAVFGGSSSGSTGSALKLWQGWLANVSATAPMPQPAEAFPLWAVADRPRFAAPAEGAVPGSAGSLDLANQADDVYFFIPRPAAGSSSPNPLPYTALRTELLRLSGPVQPAPEPCVFCASVCAARTLNAAGPPRVTLSLR